MVLKNPNLTYSKKTLRTGLLFFIFLFQFNLQAQSNNSSKSSSLKPIEPIDYYESVKNDSSKNTKSSVKPITPAVPTKKSVEVKSNKQTVNVNQKSAEKIISLTPPVDVTQKSEDNVFPLKPSPSSSVTASAKTQVTTPLTVPLKVTTQLLKVRNLEGEVVCRIREGTPLLATAISQGGDRVGVSINARGCPDSGFVDIRYVRKTKSSLYENDEAVVDEQGLSLRTSPKIAGKTYICPMPKETKLILRSDNQKVNGTTWYHVELPNPPQGCASEGWVSGNYIRANISLNDLPIISETEFEQAQTEGKACSTDCFEKETSKGTDLLSMVSKGIDAAFKLNKADISQNEGSKLLDQIKKLSLGKKCEAANKGWCHRGLVQMPMAPEAKNAGFCGSHHYGPDKPPGVDAYASPQTACAMLSVAQKWKKDFCPDPSMGCKIAWGDVSHRTKARFNGHVSHTDGDCIDIRPLRKGEFNDSGITYKNSNYDREKTKQLIDLLKSSGASTVVFNDPKLKQKIIQGHAGHIHVCFKPNTTQQKTCDEFVLDRNICPEVY